MSLLFYVGKRREVKTFAAAKVQRIFDICKRKMKKSGTGGKYTAKGEIERAEARLIDETTQRIPD
ncbi:MAG: hypothetical protein II644_03340 [Paludibacteraceae bacterium]|nr:hypothetical protein [Paludibacteraceae bacterium]